MTLEQLFSRKVNKYSIELNEKYPNMTTEEYLKELNRFANEHNAEILEEDFDWDEFDGVSKEEAIETRKKMYRVGVKGSIQLIEK